MSIKRKTEIEKEPEAAYWYRYSAGRMRNVLTGYTGIKSVAFGSCLILAYLRCAAGERWAAAQTRLRGVAPQTPFFASRRF